MTDNEQERRRILDMEPGPMLDREVAVKVFKVDNPDPRWSPSTDISAAWEVVEKMRVTHKRKFTNAMYEIMNPNREAFQIAPIDLIWYMNPLNICKAALLAVMDT